jgi:hypothetical protein
MSPISSRGLEAVSAIRPYIPNVLKHKTCALLSYYSESSDNFLPTFREDLSLPFSGIKNSKERIIGAMFRGQQSPEHGT